MICPITNTVMKHPSIVIECGHTFEKGPIEEWVRNKQRCPLCSTETQTSSLRPNYQLEQIIDEYLKTKKIERENNEKTKMGKVEETQEPQTEG